MIKRKGFAIFQLLIALAIVAVITGFSLLNATSVMGTASYAELEADASAVAMAISTYRSQVKSYPASLDVLTAKNGDYGPWLNRSTPIVDPNGNSYMYAHNSNGFAVWSVGANGASDSGGGGSTVPATISGDDVGSISK